MSLKSKIEAVIYASEEPVTLQQLVSLLSDEAQSELDDLVSAQSRLPLGVEANVAGETGERTLLEAGTREQHEGGRAAPDSIGALRAVHQGEILASGASESSMEVARETAALGPEEPSGNTSASRSVSGDLDGVPAGTDEDKRQQRQRERTIREHIRRAVDTLILEYSESDRGIEIREVASGFRMGTKPEYHDAVRGFVKSLKPALKLTLPALETLAVVAYKQPVTAAEISEIRGVDSAGVLGGLMTRKLISTAGRKQVIGRPMLYKTTRDFLLRFGLKDVNELPSMDEFERMAGELAEQDDLPLENTHTLIEQANARGDAEHIRDTASASAREDQADNTKEALAADAMALEHGGRKGDTADPLNPIHPHTTAVSAAGGTNEDSNTEKHSAEVEDVSHEDAAQPA